MKKLIFILSLMVGNAQAASVLTGGNINQWPVGHMSDTGQLVIKTQSVDASGSTATGSSVTQGTSPWVVSGSITTAGNTSLTAGTASIGTVGINANQGLSITASPGFNPLSHSTQVDLTSAARVVNLTSTAGSNVKTTFCYAPSFGGAGVRIDFGTSATAPTDLYSVGAYIATSASAQCWGPFVPGTCAYIQAAGASSVTGKQMIDGVQ